MGQPSSSSPQREDAAPQIDEVEGIASQMLWDDLANVVVQFGNYDADNGVQSGDDDDDNLENEGPRIGHGGWVSVFYRLPTEGYTRGGKF
jgi:hypothetical protein